MFWSVQSLPYKTEIFTRQYLWLIMACDHNHLQHRLLYELIPQQRPAEICSRYGEGEVPKKTCKRWFYLLKSGVRSLEHDTRSQRPVELNDETLRDLVEADPTTSIRDVARWLGYSNTTVNRPQEPENVVRYGKWIPYNPTDEQEIRECLYFLTE